MLVVCIALCLALARGGRALAAVSSAAADVVVPWWRLLGALAVCLVLAVAIMVVMKARLVGAAGFSSFRLSPSGLGGAFRRLAQPERKLRLVETLRLSHQVDICLIHSDETEFAVAASPQGGTLLFMRPRPAEPSVVEVAEGKTS